MENKKVAITMIIMTALVIASMMIGNPFHYESIPTGTITLSSFKIAIMSGEITRYHLILTANGSQITTNGEIIIATANGGNATYTLINYSNNTTTRRAFQISMSPVPEDFIMTYNNRYLTYNGLTYYTRLGPPITFFSSTSKYYSNIIIVEISQGILSWGSTTRI